MPVDRLFDVQKAFTAKQLILPAMGSLAVTTQRSPSPSAPSVAPTPDVYSSEVLQLPPGVSEDQIDNDLVTKANSLGIAASTLQKRNTGSVLSSSTYGTCQDRTFSSASPSPSNLTPHSSVFAPSITDLASSDGRYSNTSFAQYERFVASVDASEPTRFRKGSLPAINSSAQSVFSVSTKRSFSSVKSGFKPRSWLKKKSGQNASVSCYGCHTSSGKLIAFHELPCSHNYCSECLRYMIGQAIAHEASMPPRCCAQAIPSDTIQEALDRDGQQSFLKSVAEFSTPQHARIYCPNTKCADFINPHQMLDYKHPLDVKCQNCLTRVCRMCKQNAHSFGMDCPQDWELEAVKRMRQSPAWKRCYNCHNLVSLQKGATHMTCRCKEELCSVCGGIWDDTTGCPNLCNDESELERRKQDLSPSQEDADNIDKEASAKNKVEREEAENRSRRNSKVRQLIDRQNSALKRFCAYSSGSKSSMQTRHATEKLAMLEKHADEQEQMTDRHSKATSSLEDRQVAAEMELRSTLEQSERSVKIRLKHMEKYCEGLSRNPTTAATAAAAPASGPGRVVTERDLQELGQQYSLRDGMERQHQAKINVMRDRQAKRMEELLEKQETELMALADTHREESAGHADMCAAEAESLTDTLRTLQIRLDSRWGLEVEVLCKELEEADGMRYGLVSTPTWPQEVEV